jgi:hypothetical protein
MLSGTHREDAVKFKVTVTSKKGNAVAEVGEVSQEGS